MKNLTVGDICQPCSTALVVKEDDDIEAAIRRFAREPQARTLFIVDKKGRLEGLVKIRYILEWVRLKIGAGEKHHLLTRDVESFEAFKVIKLAQSTRIGDLVSPAISVKMSDSLTHSLSLMTEKEVEELAVVGDSGELVGEVKLTQILSRLLDSGTAGSKK